MTWRATGNPFRMRRSGWHSWATATARRNAHWKRSQREPGLVCSKSSGIAPASLPESDLLRWMQAHAVLPAARYGNWVGRTVRQVREEAALHVELRACLERDSAQLLNQPATAIREHLISFVRRNGPMLTKPARTPLDWRLRHLFA